MEDLAAFQVHQLPGDRRGPNVDGEAADRAPPRVDPVARVQDVVAVPDHDRVGIRHLARRARHDPEASPEDGDLDVLVRPLHRRLAGEPIRIAEELLGRGPRRQGVEPGADLHDTLVAASRPLA